MEVSMIQLYLPGYDKPFTIENVSTFQIVQNPKGPVTLELAVETPRSILGVRLILKPAATK
jgi:hypothetical protein